MLCLRNCLQHVRKNVPLLSKIHDHAIKNIEKTHEEVRIPVPWGHIAGKWWGPRDRRPIFVIHGWQDNCGSFDRLIPLLPEDLGFLTVDFPGHGYSSQLPNGLYYHGIDSAIFMKRIQDYFGWEKMSLLGHSMGGITSFMYTTLFPQHVDMLVCIDALKPFSNVPGKSIKTTVKNIEKFLYYDKLNSGVTKPPTYTFEECINKQHLGSRKSINTEFCKYILNRNVERCPDQKNKYFFTRDSRLKVGTLVGMQHEDIIEHAKRVACPHMVLKATESSYYEDKKFFYDVIDTLKKSNQLFEYHYVQGKHHVHLNEPEKVALLVNAFLSKYAYVDRSTGGIKDEIRLTQAR